MKLSEGEFKLLFVILAEKPISGIKEYTPETITVILSGLRKKLKVHFGPASDPIGRGGISPKFHIKPDAQVDTVTYQNTEGFSDEDSLF
jgi:hypothetical protein